MTSRPEGLSSDGSTQGALPALISARPWWRTPVYGVVAPAVLADATSNLSTSDAAMGGRGTRGGQTQLSGSVNGINTVNKEIEDVGTSKGVCNGQENQNYQPAESCVPAVMAEYFTPPLQLELGQTIACYPYADPYFAGIIAPYAAQALVHPQVAGMPHPRMPLPLEMTEEPVYVNAKQYHGILRRRQSRAKAELEKKVIKARKPYLHESRHQHAMRRVRGCGGRFLNTKKSDRNVAETVEENTKSQAGSPASQMFSSNSLRNQQDGFSQLETSASGRDSYQQQSTFQFSSFHPISGERKEEGDCFVQQCNGILVNQPPNMALAIQ